LIDINYVGDKKNWELASCKMLHGKVKEGFELMESFSQLFPPLQDFSQPKWDGSSFVGKTLLLHWDQGLGDTIMLVRFAQAVKALGGRVIGQVQIPLVNLVKTCPGFDEVISDRDPLPDFDIHLPFRSLPYALGTDLNTIPNTVPYLRVPEGIPNRETINFRIILTKPSLRVGITWSGNPNHKRNAQRSMPVQLLEQLSQIEQVTWYSFLHNDPKSLPIAGMVPLGDLLEDFSDTAYALSHMDFVVSVDTALAHLAGAMGIPVLLILPFMPDWRWMLWRNDSPWYPSMKLYRHPTPGNWHAAMQSVKLDIIGKVKFSS
jgi:hypothetical protein